jgi:serine/threonine-protein kinase ULK/ATG1
MRDLASGLAFLASQNLIHRDIKPQNLLLTGPLPLDELDDPSRSDEEENKRRIENFPSSQFHLKLADFGFARHLQKTSLAETLCGSPLYMAPEILQHRRYDNKADLWSAGTVLFEMIAGRPPFHGENHMDLLRNIQQKAVRLPPDVKVTDECVQLLRILLNRNPMKRANFTEFIETTNKFVAVGCNGATSVQVENSTSKFGSVANVNGIASALNPQTKANLGPISEVEESYLASSNVQEVEMQSRGQAEPIRSFQNSQAQNHGLSQHTHAYNNHSGPRPQSHFTPLQPSPPGSIPVRSSSPHVIPPMTLKSSNEPRSHSRRSDSQHSDDSSSGGFVMVEKGHQSSPTSPRGRPDERRSSLTRWSSRHVVPASALTGNASPPSSPRSNSSRLLSAGKTILSARSMIPPSIPFVRKGMLSTSPGTGGAFMGMLGSSNKNNIMAAKPTDSFDLEAATKLLSTADDVGRRAINVAHVGDTRAYLAMKLIISIDNTELHSVAEAARGGEMLNDTFSTDGYNRSRTISADQGSSKVTTSDNGIDDDDDDDDEMPFAMALNDDETVEDDKSALLAVQKQSFDEGGDQRDNNHEENADTEQSKEFKITSHFSEGLACYMKALYMLKSSVNAAQQILDQLNRSLAAASPSSSSDLAAQFKNRCEVSFNWLSGQFKGVLERADAANSEIQKYSGDEFQTMEVMSVEELIYNHSLACGKDGAVKQLLGQYENARSCYRSAGLLAETLLMEQKLVEEDKRILEGYVQGFSERINEIDNIMIQQSRHSISSSSSYKGRSSATSSRRGSSTVVPFAS